MSSTLTIKKIRNLDIVDTYGQLLKDPSAIQDNDIIKILKLAVAFLNSDSKDVRNLGYRIILFYSLKKKSFEPLFSTALRLGYFPIVKKIGDLSEDNYSFYDNFKSSLIDSFFDEGVTKTFQQFHSSNEFKKKLNNENIAYVAPTSYGKSGLMSYLFYENRSYCILVPTKSLVSQTRKRILSSNLFNDNFKIVSHPEMIEDGDENLICIFTQERLLRALQDFKELRFSTVFVDEAHNLMSDDDRNRLLAISLKYVKKRNNDVKFVYLSPFVKNISNLNISGLSNDVHEFKISEKLKSEKIFLCNLETKSSVIFDQYFNKTFGEVDCPHASVGGLINSFGTGKNIVYLNTPVKVERVARDIIKTRTNLDDPIIAKIVKDIEQYVHEDYFLIDCLKKGVVYHHGSVPDGVRLFLEFVYSNQNKINTIITTSTLMEGVNIPGDRLFVLETYKGRKSLTSSSLQNLMGRVCRFSEIFFDKDSLNLLIPHIYFVKSEFLSKRVNLLEFVKKNLKIDSKVKEKNENIYFEGAEIKGKKVEEKRKFDELLANKENGFVGMEQVKLAQTEFGKMCFKHNAIEVPILKIETDAQKMIFADYSEEKLIKNEGDLVDFIIRYPPMSGYMSPLLK